MFWFEIVLKLDGNGLGILSLKSLLLKICESDEDLLDPILTHRNQLGPAALGEKPL